MPPRPKLTIEMLRALAADALRFWGEPDLEHGLVVEGSQRMSRSIARTFPARRVIRVSAAVPELDIADARLVMWHEAAHIVVFQRQGAGGRPHGKEWASLLVSAGLQATVRIAERQHGLSSMAKSSVARQQLVYRCPVCHAVAYARKKMPRWRCAACMKNGLLGNMVADHCRP